MYTCTDVLWKAYHEVEWVKPLSEAVVEPHVQSCTLHAGSEIPHKVSLGTKFNTVPVPVVRVFEVTPSLMVLGGQHDIYRRESIR